MPNWNKIIVSGSDAVLNSLYVSGSVGIGVQSPSYKLDVSGSLRVVGNILQNNDVTSYTNPVYTNALINFYGAEQNYNGGDNLAFDGIGLGAIVSSNQNSIIVTGDALGLLQWNLAALPLSFTTATMQDNVNSISLSSNQITFPIEFNNSTYDSRADQTTIYYSTPVAPTYYISTIDHGTVVLASSLFLPNLSSQYNSNIINVDNTGKLLKSTTLPAAGTNRQLQYNSNNILAATSGLTWEPGPSNYLINRGVQASYYVMEFPLTTGNVGGGFLGKADTKELFQMGFNLQARYGGTTGNISGNQFFMYNFQHLPTGSEQYYWGFNNTGDNYWGSSNTLYSIRVQQPISSNVPLTILGRSNQTANLFEVSKDGQATGAIMMVSSSGNIGMGTTTPTQKLDVLGAVKISDVLVLPYQNPLPTGKPAGSIATSGSGATFNGLYLYNGTAWIKLSV
jgi:hypothetical protein